MPTGVLGVVPDAGVADEALVEGDMLLLPPHAHSIDVIAAIGNRRNIVRFMHPPELEQGCSRWDRATSRIGARTHGTLEHEAP
jgi:hypothetical protein